MIAPGRFVGRAPFVWVTLSAPGGAGGGFVRLLVDTGASCTVLQDADFGRLGIPRGLLVPAPAPMGGVGGPVTAQLLRGARLEFSLAAGGTHRVRIDVHVLPPPVPPLGHPSILGRDVINLAQLLHAFPASPTHPAGTMQLDF